MAETPVAPRAPPPQLVWRDRRRLWALVVLLTAALALLQVILVQRAQFIDSALPAPASSIPLELAIVSVAMDLAILGLADPYRRCAVLIPPVGLPGLDDHLTKALAPLGLRSVPDVARGGRVYRTPTLISTLWVRTRKEWTMNGVQPIVLLPRSASPFARHPSEAGQKLRAALEHAVREAAAPSDLPAIKDAPPPAPSSAPPSAATTSTPPPA